MSITYNIHANSNWDVTKKMTRRVHRVTRHRGGNLIKSMWWFPVNFTNEKNIYVMVMCIATQFVGHQRPDNTHHCYVYWLMMVTVIVMVWLWLNEVCIDSSYGILLVVSQILFCELFRQLLRWQQCQYLLLIWAPIQLVDEIKVTKWWYQYCWLNHNKLTKLPKGLLIFFHFQTFR